MPVMSSEAVATHEGPGGIQEPVHGLPQLLLPVGLGQIPLDVLHRRLQDVEPVPEVVELVSSDDQL